MDAHPVAPSFERFYAPADADAAAGGRLLLGELNCTVCHRASGAAAAQIENKQAPVLDEVAARIKPDYLRKFLANPQAARPGGTMPHVFEGVPEGEKQQQIEALTHFLMSLSPEGPPQAAAAIGGRARGEKLYHAVGCVACHGSRKDGAAPLATDKPLGSLDEKYTLPSLAAFLLDPLHVRPSGRMPSLNLTSIEARDIAAYLLPGVPEKTGLAYKYFEGSWDRLPDFDKLAPKAVGGAEAIDVSPKLRGDQFGLRFEGALAIDAEGEYTFHLHSDDGSWLKIDGEMVVNHDGVHSPSSKSGKAKLTKGVHHVLVDMFEQAGGEELDVHFEGPGVPRQKLANAIVSAQPQEKLEPLAFAVDAAKAAKGRELFASAGCAACHQLHEESGDAIAGAVIAPELARLRSGEGCLSDAAKKGVPNFALSPRQKAALAAAIASLAKLPAQPASKDIIHSTMIRLNCYACHERGGQGGLLEAHNPLFTGKEPEMGDEGRLPPPLDGVGGKLTSAWLTQILDQGAKDRPYMHARMPGFGAKNAGHLQKLLEETDKLPPLPPLAINEKDAKMAGWQMVGEQGFGCIKCHNFGRFASTGIQSMDMTIMHKRLREEWFRRYVDDPLAFRKGTRMPDAWPSADGRSLLPKILDGQNATQIQAVWTYLADGPRARTPAGLVSDSMELIPGYEAIIYRNFIEGAGPRAIGVGYPEHMSIAFDANNMRIALLWQGAFIDASKHWKDRGAGFQGPAGEKVVKLPSEPPLAVLDSAETAWPGQPPRASGYRFRGYRLTPDRRPTFLYTYNGIAVEDFPTPVEAGVKTLLRRSFTLTAEKPPENLYFRAAAGGAIKPSGDGWFDVDGQMRIRVTGGEPSIRTAGGKQELLMPVKFDGKTAKITQEYEW